MLTSCIGSDGTTFYYDCNQQQYDVQKFAVFAVINAGMVRYLIICLCLLVVALIRAVISLGPITDHGYCAFVDFVRLPSLSFFLLFSRSHTHFDFMSNRNSICACTLLILFATNFTVKLRQLLLHLVFIAFQFA